MWWRDRLDLPGEIMNGQTRSIRTSSGGGVSSPPGQGSTASPAAPDLRTRLEQPLLRSKYQHLTRKHLDSLLARLFAEYTGLHFHTAWAPPEPRDWDSRTLPTGCSAGCRLARTSLQAKPLCEVCGPRQLARALNGDGDGLWFRCRFGIRNYWLPIRVRGVTIGIAYLQALDGTPPEPALRKWSASAETKILPQSKFRRAGRLLRLFMGYVQALDLAELRKSDLTNAGHALLALEKEQARLHDALQRHLPAPSLVARRARLETHTDQAAQSLLNCISRNYAQPITLRQCAAKLGMNAAYLSALFSRTVGRPFKACLTACRMEKAKALLSDPAKFVSDVAYAVGYASENQFRIAFKKATGLAPKIWRQTLRTQSVALIMWLVHELELLENLPLPDLL
jgi:AraC-like DNA-binding protein